jgi:hypothetical protein
LGEDTGVSNAETIRDVPKIMEVPKGITYTRHQSKTYNNRNTGSYADVIAGRPNSQFYSSAMRFPYILQSIYIVLF